MYDPADQNSLLTRKNTLNRVFFYKASFFRFAFGIITEINNLRQSLRDFNRENRQNNYRKHNY
ncbi:hypothetical protein DN748_05185 [Sinomicrobium soli]|nr:hypothetical protein DN748_05185 [Sinomicrobium sp. N-1-3-6]